MAKVPFTLRIDSKERQALENLSKVEGRPVNQLLNDAVKGYLNQKGRREVSLEANLAALRAYRMRDPGFEVAIAAFVDAEASLDDPLEGTVVAGETVDGQLKSAGSVQSKMRELLRA